MFSDFGMLGKAVDFWRSLSAQKQERQLQEKFVAILKRLQANHANVYNPELGSPEYWNGKEMVKRGWLIKAPISGFMQPHVLASDLYY